MQKTSGSADKFVAPVTAIAEVDLRLTQFGPRSMLAHPVHTIECLKSPAVDYHNHVDAQDPRAVLEIMDACDIEWVINITMKARCGSAASDQKNFRTQPRTASPTIACMDRSDLHTTVFFSVLQLASCNVLSIRAKAFRMQVAIT